MTKKQTIKIMNVCFQILYVEEKIKNIIKNKNRSKMKIVNVGAN